MKMSQISHDVTARGSSGAHGKFLILTVSTYAVLDWLLSYFRIWPPDAMYVTPFVSVYLVLFLFPGCLDGMQVRTKDSQLYNERNAVHGH